MRSNEEQNEKVETRPTPEKQQAHSSTWGTVIRRTGWMASVVVLIGLYVSPAHAQFGIDTALIIESLNQLNSMMQSAIGEPLKQINRLQSEINQFEQQVIYPVQAIEQAKQSASSSLNVMQQVNQVINVSRASAQLPTARQLEQQLLSADPNNVSSVSNSYAQVYGSLPDDGTVPPQVRNMVDMTDAQAQSAMKKAIQLDALAAREMEMSQNILNQLQNAAPGTAPILNAQASAWVLQGNAYSQSAMAELLRTRSASLSAAGTMSKNRATNSQNAVGAVQNLLNKVSK